MRRLALFLFGFISLVVPARADFDHSGLARDVVEQHIQPGYARLHERTMRLDAAVKVFCEKATARSLDPLKDAFTDAALAWAFIEHVRFGPVMKQERHARMMYWPDRKGIGRRQVARALRKRDASVTSQASLQNKSVALQGFGALEQILYGQGNDGLLKPGPSRKHRCGFMQAIAANMAKISGSVLEAWSREGSYRKVFFAPGADNPVYLEPSEVTLEIAKMFLVGLERLRDVRIAGALGLQKNSSRKKSVAFEASGLSMQALVANLEGLAHLFREGGIMKRLETAESGIGRALQNDLDISLKEMRSISVPVAAAVENPESEGKLIAVGFPLKNVREETARVLSQAAGLSLGFNALDGD